MDQDDLYSGQPFWRLVGPPPDSFPRLAEDATCEVAIIGGGITGALAAQQLARSGVDTLIVDRETFATGSTVASTGLIEYELDWPLIKLIERFGEAAAVRAYRCGLEAVEQLAGLNEALRVDCGFQRRPTVQIASQPADVPVLREEARCRQHFGFEVECFERDALREFGGFAAPGALWSRGDAELDPYRFTQGVLRQIADSGGRAFANTEVCSLRESSNAVELETNGGRITARSVIVATGYASGRFLRHDVGVLRTTYAAVSQPLADFASWPERCLIWETAHPYFYARTSEDGRAIIGGEDTASPGDHENKELLRRKVAQLTTRFAALFPDIEFQLAGAWAGVFGESRDGLPSIGRAPGSQRIYHALGYGGNGITFGMVAAQILSDLILGRPNADAAIFGFER
jgi:glycine/D-amino acid oxidase-like deaminating enzyme